jgi:hypothetical protein
VPKLSRACGDWSRRDNLILEGRSRDRSRSLTLPKDAGLPEACFSFAIHSRPSSRRTGCNPSLMLAGKMRWHPWGECHHASQHFDRLGSLWHTDCKLKLAVGNRQPSLQTLGTESMVQSETTVCITAIFETSVLLAERDGEFLLCYRLRRSHAYHQGRCYWRQGSRDINNVYHG